MPLRPSIRDHTDRRFRLHPVPRAGSTDLPKPIADRIRTRLVNDPTRHTAVAASAAITALSLLFTAAIIATGPSAAVALVAIAAATSSHLIRRFILRTHEPIIAAFLAEKRCPACAYPLPITHDARGLTTCPECAAAWIVPL